MNINTRIMPTSGRVRGGKDLPNPSMYGIRDLTEGARRAIESVNAEAGQPSQDRHFESQVIRRFQAIMISFSIVVLIKKLRAE